MVSKKRPQTKRRRPRNKYKRGMNKITSMLSIKRKTGQKVKPISHVTKLNVDGFSEIIPVKIDELIREKKREKKGIEDLLNLNNVKYLSKDMKDVKNTRKKNLDSQLNAINKEIEDLHEEKKIQDKLEKGIKKTARRATQKIKRATQKN